MPNHKQRGFTLLEMMVALSVFALIGLMANQLLNTMLRTQQTAEVRVTRLQEIHRLLALLEDDLTHSLSAENSELAWPGSIRFSAANGQEVLKMVRKRSLPDRPAGHSQLESIEWRWEKSVLRRLSFGDPLSNSRSKPQITTRFDGVSQVGLRFWQKGRWVAGWGSSVFVPAAAEVSLNDRQYGKIEKIVLMHSSGTHE